MSSLKLRAELGNITKIGTEAIVNAANTFLLGGGGVDGAIHAAAGPELLAECRTLKGCKVGEAKVTGAYGITGSKAIIHTVGPQIHTDSVSETERKQLSQCYVNSLKIADNKGLSSIAFPCISTGIYSFPNKLACETAISSVSDYFAANPSSQIKSVVFCCFLDIDYELYERALSA